MLLASLGHLKGLLYDEGVIIDDPIFKLFYGFTTILLLVSSILVTGKVYLGDPIHCTLYYYEFDKVINPNMLNTYCYIHSSFIVPSSTQTETDLVYKFPGVGPYHPDKQKEDIILQSYYQWVSLLFLIQGFAFYIPHFFWQHLENGTMKSLRLCLHDPAIPNEKLEANLNQLAEYFQRNRGRHQLYGKHYLYCIFMNMINLVLQIGFTDLVLNGNFISYGWKFSYRTKGVEVVTQDILFPKMSKCNMQVYGSSGTLQRFDALCVLPLNILHDKIFLLLWFWYLFLLFLSIFALAYWLRHYCQPSYRLKHIEYHLKGTVKGNRLKYLNKTFGDWFVLHQLYKNIQHSNFTQLVSRLCRADEKPLRKNETYIQFKLDDEDIEAI